MATAPILKTHKIEVLSQDGQFQNVGEVIDRWMASFPGDVGTISVSGTFELDEDSRRNWTDWHKEVIRHTDQRTAYLEGLAFLWSHISFRALVIGSRLFTGDEWEPISKDGMLPYASQWVADLIANFRKADAKERKIVLSSEYGSIGTPGWWSRQYGWAEDWADTLQHNIFEMKTSGRWPR